MFQKLHQTNILVNKVNLLDVFPVLGCDEVSSIHDRLPVKIEQLDIPNFDNPLYENKG